ncbi:T9SS type A sorting domain-containing protein [Hymenobacter sp. BT683]|uniref:T9SS type A sorting domain-containing protein n=1 Tax=Hymenobacter jeongseonensis TaxID=2791027 RepID=A0ABS0IND7_9BACT|nr:T9SS type A sorting domain-containing protein [Hymenobacter jeongseonensis]MBF9239863.1 T9SS type A sorting domain-containing protein [Hymenobacter jeongseonensis]
MKNKYLNLHPACWQRLYGFLLLCLLLPTVLQAQSVTVEVSPGNSLPLQNFGKIPVNRVSASQSFLLSGDDLTGEVTVTAPEGFQIRTGGNAFSTSSLVFSAPTGTLSATTIDVRFAPVASVSRPDGKGNYASNILVSTPSGESTASQTVAVAGTAPVGAYVFVDPATLAFGALSQSGSGQVLTFVVGGGGLGTTALRVATALSGATTSGSVQIRNPAITNSPFTTSLTINPVGGQVPQTTLQARIVGPIPSQSNFTGTITATSGTAEAAPNNVVQVTGTNSFTGTNTSSTFTVSTPPSNPITPGFPSGGQPLLPFSTVPEKASATQTLVVSGSFLVQDITVKAPNNFQVSLDAAFPGLGNGGTGTVTGNSIAIAAPGGTVNNTTVYLRYLPLVAGKQSGTGITFNSAPATSIATIVQANSIGSIESRTVYTPEGPLVIGESERTAPQLIRIRAELLRSPVKIMVSGESEGALGNPEGYAQFQISLDGITYTDPTSPGTSFIELTPNSTTHVIDQDIYVAYAPNRVGAAQAVLQYLTADLTTAPANTLTDMTSGLAGPDSNKLRGTAVDSEPTLETPFTAERVVGSTSAAITFNPENGFSGYGEFHIVLISTKATLVLPDMLPVDGTDYNAGNGTYQGAGQSVLQDSQGNEYFVVFSGGAPTATITGLMPSTTYYAYVFDYNSTNPNETQFINNAENYKGPAQSLVIGAELPGEPPLPVELSAFSAKADGTTAVRLAWTTASEMHNDHFAVERSLDGRVFTTVGTVDGAGTSSSALSYSFRDAKLPASATILYYRLRQVDTNGPSTYSPMRSVVLGRASLAAQLQTYPNPAHGSVAVRILGPLPTAPLQLYNATGRLVRTQPVTESDGDISFSLRDLPAGIYILRCGALSQRLMVQ